MTIRRIFGLTLALAAVVVLAAGTSNGGASSKFAYTAEVTATGGAVIHFEEMTLKRFEVVDYQLDATADAFSSSFCDTRQILHRLFPTASISLTPDHKGRVSGSLTLDLSVPQELPCQYLRRVEYTNVTLTNVTTGHVYRLDPVSRDIA
jgi:hypothetical protein